MLNCRYLVCPNGQFQPKKYDNNVEADKAPSGFSKVNDFSMRCYRHDTNYFIVFYSNNGEKNMRLTKDSGNLSLIHI